MINLQHPQCNPSLMIEHRCSRHNECLIYLLSINLSNDTGSVLSGLAKFFLVESCNFGHVYRVAIESVQTLNWLSPFCATDIVITRLLVKRHRRQNGRFDCQEKINASVWSRIPVRSVNRIAAYKTLLLASLVMSMISYAAVNSFCIRLIIQCRYGSLRLE